ncbi:MAG: SH3 domain-containing protein [Firmicutes bacterium]|nr:SH3 domain-containing protein [Bacillota bacterium]
MQALLIYLLTIFLSLTGFFGTRQSTTELASPVEVGESALVGGEQVVLREGPGGAYAPVKTLAKGEELQVIAEQDGWYQVQTSTREVGWVAGWLLKGDPMRSSVSHRPRQVIGYYVDDLRQTGYESLVANDHWTAVAPWAYMLDGEGNLQGKTPAKVLELAGSRGKQTLALIHNYHGDKFDGDMVGMLLANPQARRQAVESIHQMLRRWGYSGVNIDFENVPHQQRENLNAFMQELADRLQPEGLLVTMSVPAKTDKTAKASWTGAYDYNTLGRIVDGLQLMTYDEHYRDGSPGPIASIGWVEDVITYALKHVPRSKLYLGIALYGYDWEEVAPGQWTGKAITQRGAASLAETKNVPVNWDAVHKVPHFSYTDLGNRHVVYFEDRYSLSHKLYLVNKYDLAGIALWRLGFEDPAAWSIIGRSLRP